MSGAIPGVWPAVLQPETRRCLDEYRAFRHVVRNVYSFQLQPERVETLASGVAACFRRLCEDLERFCRFLSEDDAHDT